MRKVGWLAFNNINVGQSLIGFHDGSVRHMKPFCFALMSFGQELDESNRHIDFDRVHAEVIKPAVNERH